MADPKWTAHPVPEPTVREIRGSFDLGDNTPTTYLLPPWLVEGMRQQRAQLLAPHTTAPKHKSRKSKRKAARAARRA